MGIWPGHRGYTPTLYEKCHGIFNNHRESAPRFNVSSESSLYLSVFHFTSRITHYFNKINKYVKHFYIRLRNIL